MSCLSYSVKNNRIKEMCYRASNPSFFVCVCAYYTLILNCIILRWSQLKALDLSQCNDTEALVKRLMFGKYCLPFYVLVSKSRFGNQVNSLFVFDVHENYCSCINIV